MRSLALFAFLLPLVVGGIGRALADDAQSPDAAAKTRSFVYKHASDTDLKLIVHFPPGWREGGRRPAIVFFFGGGWANGSPAQFQTQCEALASRGMVAARADYRVKSRQPGITPRDCVEDARSAVRWMRRNAAMLGIDPDRLAVGGGSAGGHIAACTSLAPGVDAPGEDTGVSCKANALVLYNPVLSFDARIIRMTHVDADTAAAISPTAHLSKDAPPTLLLYGTADALREQGDEFLKQAKALGVRCEMYLAEGQKHGFFNRSPWREKTTARVIEFLESIGYLKSEKAGEEEGR